LNLPKLIEEKCRCLIARHDPPGSYLVLYGFHIGPQTCAPRVNLVDRRLQKRVRCRCSVFC